MSPTPKPQSSSLPKPQFSSSLFSSLPIPKSHLSTTQFNPKQISSSANHGQDDTKEKGLPRYPDSAAKTSSGLFSSLPAPKSHSNSDPISSSSGSGSATQKMVVQLRPPVIQSSFFQSDDKDDDEGDEQEVDKKKPQMMNSNSSVKSFISSMPAPKNSATLGTFSGSGGSGRRAIVDTAVTSLTLDAYNAEKEVAFSSNGGSVSSSVGAAEGHLGGGVVAGGDVTNLLQPGESYVGYEGYESYANYESYGNDGHYD